MSDKQLIIPIVTPLRKTRDNQFVTEMPSKEEIYLHRDFYICSQTLNDLRNSIGENYDFVVPAMSAGEGDHLDFELWKSITALTIDIFKNEKGKIKSIPCILKIMLFKVQRMLSGKPTLTALIINSQKLNENSPSRLWHSKPSG